ncbi:MULTISPECIES: Crp/Fnr family transcriptional regulator [Paenibacillus]|jgi:CRP-like cAMP-binding protein|uniref:Crp/Fnr family transcriptional regulator n=1 Tax=Paenibacillus azoreducens TaxID=116718 RepID=A0A919YI99_9BACL|nr:MULTISPECIES: Crp/Fnr family transcriptional regulator [Paenibacillus]MBE9914679.1 Crp/Fnr family transcriptional regulator [Paenibacillus donghaensis]GIO51259.1 Crp/Fnr family transcriptional regulator [Paenibacillus azoreducens]
MSIRNVEKDLKQFELFAHLSDKKLKALTEFVYWRTYKKGQFLFLDGDSRERIYLMLDGFVKLERVNQSGNLLYEDHVKQYSIFPYGGMFTDKRYSYSAEALTDVDVYYIPTAIFEDMLKSNQGQLIYVVQELSSILKLHENRVQNITIPNAQDRVTQALNYLMRDLGERNGEEIIISCPLTTIEISKISGTSRETVSGVLNHLKKNNIITISGKKIIIHDPTYFEKISM